MNRRRTLVRHGVIVLLQLATVAAALIGWQLAAEHHVINTFYYSEPTAIWDYIRLWASSDQPAGLSTGTTLWQDLGATCIVFGVGYVVGVVGGVALGLLIGLVRPVREVLEPFIAFGNAVPKLLLLPLLIVMFGFGFVPQIILVLSVILLFVTIAVAAGVEEIPVMVRDHARVLGASRTAVMRHIYLPSMSIWVIGTSRLTIGYAIQASIAAQFIGASRGLGFRFVDAESTYRPAEMFAGFLIVLILAVAVDLVLGLAQRRVTRWMPGVET